MSGPAREIANAGGNRLRVLTSARQSAGEFLQLEATYAPRSPRPPEHFHPRQHESFEILQGEFHACIGGESRTYRAGDRFEIPAGVRHWMHNVSDDEGRLLWRVRPALRTQELLERSFGMAESGGAEGGKFRRLVWVAGLLREFRAEFRLTRPPAPVQWLLIHTLGRLRP